MTAKPELPPSVLTEAPAAELHRLRGIEARAREIWAHADDEPMAAPSALVAARYILGED